MVFISNSIISQIPCKKTLGDYTVETELDPEVIFNPLIEGQTPPQFDPPEADERDEYIKAITWVHGMNGTNASWIHASDYADDHYNALPIRLDYNNFQASLLTVRAGVKDDFLNKWEATKDLTSEQGKRNSFAIAHSLGGIAIRGASESYDYLEGKVNGIVTVCSPHGGSNLAYYVDTPEGPGSPSKVQAFKDFAASACSAFGLGPIKEEISENAFLNAISKIGFLEGEEILDAVCSGVTSFGVPKAIKNIAPMSVSELTPNSAALNIDSKVPDAHKMLFATSIVDDPDAHHNAFKIFYSGQNSPSDRGRWQADVLTTEALEDLDSDRNWYNAKHLEWKNHYDSKPWYKANWQCFKTFGFGPCITYNDCLDISNGYTKGLNQFRKVNDYWEYALGAREYIPLDFGACCVENDYGEGGCIQNMTEEECYDLNYNDIFWSPYQVYSNVKDYDGLLTTESQSAWESCLEENKIILAKSSDHLQIKNDSNTKFIVDYTLSGEGVDFFTN